MEIMTEIKIAKVSYPIEISCPWNSRFQIENGICYHIIFNYHLELSKKIAWRWETKRNVVFDSKQKNIYQLHTMISKCTFSHNSDLGKTCYL